MPTASKYGDSTLVQDLEACFDVPLVAMKRIMRDFLSEMTAGLSGTKSSLRMIPAYVDRPTGEERGRFIALDLGGTNFRVLEIELKGGRSISKPIVKNFMLEKRLITGESGEFFDFIAASIGTFLEEKKIPPQGLSLGFTFSFPVQQTKINSGVLVGWTKGFSVKGVIGSDVINLLKRALDAKGLGSIAVTALANDTVGTLAAKSYEDPNCDIGIILGTGTNACYSESLSKIYKWKGPKTPTGRMIINTEWGNFNKLRITAYDEQLDKFSENPAEQILEKRVSGMYLGELVRLVCKGCIDKKQLFKGITSPAFDERNGFRTEHMSMIEADSSKDLSDTENLLKKLGIAETSLADRRLTKKICCLISSRAARVSAAVIAAVVAKIDPDFERDHTVAVDGTVYEKHPTFSENIKHSLKELLEERSSRVTLSLAKDGSGKGAAVIAAVASEESQ